MLLFWKLDDESQISKSQDLTDIFKHNLISIFLSVRPKLLLTFQYEIPCKKIFYSNPLCYFHHRLLRVNNFNDAIIHSLMKLAWNETTWFHIKQTPPSSKIILIVEFKFLSNFSKRSNLSFRSSRRILLDL